MKLLLDSKNVCPWKLKLELLLDEIEICLHKKSISAKHKF